MERQAGNGVGLLGIGGNARGVGENIDDGLGGAVAARSIKRALELYDAMAAPLRVECFGDAHRRKETARRLEPEGPVVQPRSARHGKQALADPCGASGPRCE